MQIRYSHPLAIHIGRQRVFNGYEQAENTTKCEEEEEVMIITLVVLVTHMIWHDGILKARFAAYGQTKLSATTPHPLDPVMPSHDDMGSRKQCGFPRDEVPCRLIQ